MSQSGAVTDESHVRSGRRLAILNLQPHVYEVFSVTRLNTLFDVRQQEAA